MPGDVGLHLPFQVLDRHQRGEGASFEQLPDGTPEEAVQILRPGQGRVPLRKQVLLQARRCQGKWEGTSHDNISTETHFAAKRYSTIHSMQSAKLSQDLSLMSCHDIMNYEDRGIHHRLESCGY